jgi:phosphatidate cytidylyltransferase
MLKERVKTALILLPIILSLIIFGQEFGTAILLAAASYVGVGELLRFSTDRFTAVEIRGASVWGALIAFSFLFDISAAPGALLALGTLFFMLKEAINTDPDKKTLERIFHLSSAWFLVAYFLGHGVLIRGYGASPFIFLMILVMAGDSAAYFVGSAIGKRKLAPRVSPNKSIEGSIGGICGAALCGGLFSSLLELPHGVSDGVFIAIIINIIAQAGDLVESLLKRSADVKDSGTIFPGHGGMLDRVDSFLPTIPLYAAILAFYGG